MILEQLKILVTDKVSTSMNEHHRSRSRSAPDRRKLVNEHSRGWSPNRSRHDRDSHRSHGRREHDTSPIKTHFGKGMRVITEATHSKFLQ